LRCSRLGATLAFGRPIEFGIEEANLMTRRDEADAVCPPLADSFRRAILAHEQEGEALDELGMLLVGSRRGGRPEIRPSWRDRLGEMDSAEFGRIMRRQITLTVLGMIAAAAVMFFALARFVPAR